MMVLGPEAVFVYFRRCTDWDISYFTSSWVSFPFPSLCLVMTEINFKCWHLHLHNTKQSSKLHINTIRNNFGKDTLKYIGTTNWNHLPKSIIQNKTIKSETVFNIIIQINL